MTPTEADKKLLESVKDEVAKKKSYSGFKSWQADLSENFSDPKAALIKFMEEVAELYHLRKLEEAGKKLPTIADLQNEFMHYPNRTQMVSEIMLKLEQASTIIASLQSQLEQKCFELNQMSAENVRLTLQLEAKEKRAVNFADWILQSRWQMAGQNTWATKRGDLVHGIIEEVKTTKELYEIFKSQLSNKDKA